jgi:FixJ family two-component response regulator
MIAIVDDDSAIRRSLARVISSAGYSVSAFASAHEFLSRLNLQQKVRDESF